MKKLFFTAALLAGVFSTYGQQWTGNTNTTDPISRTGNVGIGINNPTEKLEVKGTVKAKQGTFENGIPDGATFATSLERWTKSLTFAVGKDSAGEPLFSFYDMPQSNFNPKSTIWFLIEDRNDKSRLRFIAEANGATNYKLYNKSQEQVYSLYENGNNVYVDLPKANSKLRIGGAVATDHKLHVYGGSAMIEGNILTDENIGIGTDSFTDGTDTYRLSVDGKVRANSVKVYTDWADFVFEDTYELSSLEEVENHIKENGHLKDIPSAKEVEENGIELGEMNKLLLQKVEELTLYLIEQNKEIVNLKKEVETFKTQK